MTSTKSPQPTGGAPGSRSEQTPAAGCPVQHGANHRKTLTLTRPDTAYSVDDNGVWHISGTLETRQILRSEHITQAGFLAEYVTSRTTLSNPPMVYREGEAHREQRRNVARFFIPKQIATHYDMMSDYADEILTDLQAQGRADFSDLSMRLAVHVAAQIIGLTNSRIGGMDRRIDRMLSLDVEEFSWSPANISKMFMAQVGTFAFFTLDVKPAIKARKAKPQDDLISHLIAQGYSDAEILVECITFGAAGMVTTREFIAIALLHCLENPTFQDLMLTSDQAARYDFLYEILRLEPVVGHLRRRATADIVFESDGASITIPAGALIDFNLYAANAEEAIVGENPDALCPGRELTKLKPRVQPWVLGFGEGHHHCPGQPVAIQETDIFLRKLLALPTLRIEESPTITRNELVKGYEIRNFMVAVD